MRKNSTQFMCHEIQKPVTVAIIVLNNALSKYFFWRRDGIISFGLTSVTKHMILEVHNTMESKSCFVCEQHGGTENKAEAIEELRSSGLLLLALYLHPMQVVKIRELLKRG
jgi:hypothetical protein